MSKTALVTFTPLEPYFFGGETTHGNGRGSNYFSKSNLYPQQTTLCGTLRNLLRLAGYKFGAQSFTPDKVAPNNFEDLLGLSPLFLKNPDGHYFLRQALDRQPGDSEPLRLETALPKAWALLDNGVLEYPTKWSEGSRWPTFEPKRKRANEWVSPDAAAVKPEAIFTIFNRPGIPKQEIRNPKPDGPGLFKQDLVRLADEWAFCALVEFSEKVDIDQFHRQHVQLGGEKSIFHIKVEEDSRSFEGIFNAKEMFYRENPPTEPRLVLASDAWVPDSVWQHTIGAVTETTDFRHIRTHLDVKHFGRMRPPSPDHVDSDDKTQLAKSTKYTLLARGSVLLCPDKTALNAAAKALTVQPWHGIGFNHFITYCP